MMLRPLLLLLAGLCAFGCGDDDASTDAGPGADAPRADAPDDDGGPDGVDTGGVDAPPGVDTGPTACSTTALPEVALEDVARFRSPVFVTSAPGDDDTLYVVEKGGAIRVVEGGTTVRDQNFLDIGGLLTSGEQGLLGLAFHPDYESNGRFFVYVTPDAPRRNTVREYRRSSDDPYRADSTAVATLVDERDSESNHNGGMIAFGPDGYLYVGMGDEGGGGDRHGPTGNGLNTQTLFGSILRLDVDAGPGYAAPGNPFDGSDGHVQIWAYGLRNPWRMSFDRDTGDLWIGDVGQGSFEEITFMQAPIDPGANLGWRAYEGFSVFDEGLVSMVPDHFEPIIDYRQGRDDEPIQQGCSVTGGFVYRGSAIPDLQGWYLYGDYCSPSVAAIRTCEGELQDHERIDDLSFGGSNLVSFGENGHGDLFIVFLDGSLRRIVPG